MMGVEVKGKMTAEFDIRIIHIGGDGVLIELPGPELGDRDRFWVREHDTLRATMHIDLKPS